MSAHGFICVGGPLDGKWWPQRDRQTRFEVVDPPRAMTQAYSAEFAAQPCDLVVKHHWYTLREHDLHGAAWVYQS